MFGEILLILLPQEIIKCSSKGPKICRETFFARNFASTKLESHDNFRSAGLLPWLLRHFRTRVLYWTNFSLRTGAMVFDIVTYLRRQQSFIVTVTMRDSWRSLRKISPVSVGQHGSLTTRYVSPCFRLRPPPQLPQIPSQNLSFPWRLLYLVNFLGSFENSCEFWWPSLGEQAEIHHNSGVSAFCAYYDGFLWIFPRNVIKIRMNSRNSLYNAPGKEVSNKFLRNTQDKRSASKSVQKLIAKSVTATKKIHRTSTQWTRAP